MGYRKRPLLTGTVAPETLVEINKLIQGADLSVGHALDVIVREWLSSKETRNSKCSCPLNDIQEIKQRINEMQIQLLTVQQVIINADISFKEDE